MGEWTCGHVHFIGCLAAVGAIISHVTTFFTNHWVTGPDGYHAGMFQNCHRINYTNRTREKDSPQEECKDIGMDLPVWLHFARMFAILTMIVYGLSALLGTLNCKIEGTTFKQKHFGEMVFLIGASFAWISHSLFLAFWEDYELYSEGWLGGTYYTALISSCLMPVAVILMIAPTVYSKFQTYKNKRVTTVRTTNRNATSPANIQPGDVDRFRNLTRLHPLPSATGPDSRARSPAQVSVVPIEDTHFINEFPTVDDILNAARQRGNNDPAPLSSNGQLYPIPAVPPNSALCGPDQQRDFTAQPPSYDSIRLVSPPPAYDYNGGVVTRTDIGAQAHGVAAPPSYDDALLYDKGNKGSNA